MSRDMIAAVAKELVLYVSTRERRVPQNAAWACLLLKIFFLRVCHDQIVR